MRPLVLVDLNHSLSDLYCWGRDAAGWWALVSWSIHGRVSGQDGLGSIDCSAWVPARHVFPAGDPHPQAQRQRYQDVQRLALPPDRSSWPHPHDGRGQVWHHFGAITADPGKPPALEHAVGINKR